ncbi:MAG: acetolactate synthase small subunit [Firmicutes bacterium]|nr:acetolactate synthase small subunit [Bacillota bacterium]
MQHVLSVLVENRSGVLSRVAGLFSRRGYSIDSIAVGPTEDAAVSRMVIMVEADEEGLEQITKQLHKLIDVLKISDITKEPRVERELALIKVQADGQNRGDILQIVDIFRAKIVDVAEKSLVIEITGDTEKVDALIQLLHSFGIKELVRTGRIAMVRGMRSSGEDRSKS